jgi:hypothetical protein
MAPVTDRQERGPVGPTTVVAQVMHLTRLRLAVGAAQRATSHFEIRVRFLVTGSIRTIHRAIRT